MNELSVRREKYLFIDELVVLERVCWVRLYKFIDVSAEFKFLKSYVYSFSFNTSCVNCLELSCVNCLERAFRLA